MTGADYSVDTEMILPSGGTGAIISRSDTPTSVDKNGYAAQISTAGSVTLYRRNNWEAVPLATASATIDADSTHRLQLVTRGSNPVHLEVWLDGIQKLTHDDSSSSRLTSGVPAMATFSSGVQYDYVTLGSVPPLYSDDFNRTSGLGADWSVLYGSYSTDGAVTTSGTPPVNGNWAGLVPAVGATDYSVSARLSVPSGSLYAGVVARSSDQTNIDRTLYAAQISTDGAVNLYRRNDWSWTLLGTASQTVTAGQFYNLKLIASGSNPVHLEVWLDGTQRITYDDSSTSRVTSGGPAIQNYNSGVKYDWFRVETP